MRCQRRLALLVLLLPTLAAAWPVDVAMPLEVGRERFHRLTTVDWVEVEDASIASAEILPGSNELLLTGLKPGSTLLLLYASGRFAVWRLTVSPPGSSPAEQPYADKLAAARKACPGLEASTSGPEPSLSAVVKDEPCRQALLTLLQTEAFLARHLDLTLELPVLQRQLASLATALQPLGLSASYRGAGLLLQGAASPQNHRRALWALFHLSAGRVPLEDKVSLPAPPTDPTDARSQTKTSTPEKPADQK